MSFDTLKDGQRIELALLHLDIAGHSGLPGTDRSLQIAKTMLRRQAEGIADIRGGRLFQWAGDGGAFMFLTGNGEGFDDVAFTAIQILGTLPGINEEIRTRTDLENGLSLRLCCDCGTATYHTDPSLITADFINRFMKYERAISLTDTISITDRVWDQCSTKIQRMFREFKHSLEVEASIYNRGGKERQLQVLSALHNKVNTNEVDREGEFVQVIAFKGDTLLSLSREAYSDVLGQGEESIDRKYKNVGGLNLLVTRNAELSRKHDERRIDDEPRWTDARFNLREILHSRPDVDPRLIHDIEMLWPHVPPHIRHQAESDLRRAESRCHVHEVLEGLRRYSEMGIGHPQWTDPLAELKGGESLRFYNCAALGFNAVIGDSTLLDHVFAEQLSISRVTAGVEHTAASVRTFLNKNGVYVEEGAETDDNGNTSGDDSVRV